MKALALAEFLGLFAVASFILSSHAIAPPPNDHFRNAATITAGVVYSSGRMTLATYEEGEPLLRDFPRTHSLWWRWTAPANGMATLELRNTDFWPLLGIFQGDQLSDLSPVPMLQEGIMPPPEDGSIVVAPGPSYFAAQTRWHFPARAGETYYLLLDTSPPPVESAATDLVLWHAPAPPNDDFARAQELPPATSFFAGDFSAAAWEPDEQLTPGASGRTLWYRWTASQPGTYLFTSQGTNEPPLLSVWTDNAEGPVRLKHNAGEWRGPCGVFWRPHNPFVLNLRQPGTFFLQLDTRHLAHTADFELRIDHFAPPANDDFGNATLLSGTALLLTNSTAGATIQPGEPAHGFAGGSSLWYRWTAPGAGSLTVNTNPPNIFSLPTVTNLPSLFDSGYHPPGGHVAEPPEPILCVPKEVDPYVFFPHFAVYQGTQIEDLIQLNAGEDLRVPVEQGETYYLAADASHGLPGPFNMSLAFNDRPANDDFSHGIPITGGHVKVTGHNAGATTQPGEPGHSPLPPQSTVWWRWTAPGTGPVTITWFSEAPLSVTVFDGRFIPAFTLISSDTNEVTFSATRDRQYQIQVASETARTGFLELHLQMIPPRINLIPEGAIYHQTFSFWHIGAAGQEIMVERSFDLNSWELFNVIPMDADVITLILPLEIDRDRLFYRTRPKP